MKTSKPEDEQEKCRLYVKMKLSAYNPRHIGKGIKYSNSLTQHNSGFKVQSHILVKFSDVLYAGIVSICNVSFVFCFLFVSQVSNNLCLSLICW